MVAAITRIGMTREISARMDSHSGITFNLSVHRKNNAPLPIGREASNSLHFLCVNPSIH